MKENMTLTPRMMSIRQIAQTGILSEHALRVLLKEGKLPGIRIGNKVMVNYDALCRLLNSLGDIPFCESASTSLYGGSNANELHY